MKLGTRKCHKCGTTVPKNKKYRVIVRVDGTRVTRTTNNLELARDVEAKLKEQGTRDDL